MSTKKKVKRLIRLMRSDGTSPAILNTLVGSVACGIAKATNERGIKSQMRYILKSLGRKGATKVIRGLAYENEHAPSPEIVKEKLAKASQGRKQ